MHKKTTIRLSQKAMDEFLRRRYGRYRNSTAAAVLMDVANEFEELAESQRHKMSLGVSIEEERLKDLKERAAEYGCLLSEFLSSCLEKAADQRYGVL